MQNLISARVKNIKPSTTLALAAKTKELQSQGKNIIDLTLGEPDFSTPENAKEAAIAAIQNNLTHYTQVDGIPSLKKAIIAKLKNENNLEYQLNQILVSVGGKHSLYNVFHALINDGDEVIIPAPYWVSYPDIAKLAGGIPVILAAGIDENYKITPAKLEKIITQKTKIFIINSPSNPTGVAYTKKELEELGQILLKHPNIVVVTDDIYEHILWNGEKFANIVNACPALYERTIVVNGVSKSYAMTGWRIGYAAGDVSIIAAMKKLQSQCTSNPTSIAQVAAEAALKGDQNCILKMTQEFKRRHDFIVGDLQKIPGIKVHPADGAFYSFPNIEDLMEKFKCKDDVEFTELLLQKAEVSVVPGSAFGADGYIRISYATSMENLKTALERIARFATQI
jgi:aspartate aminotransferase